MKELSNNTLILIAVASIVISLFNIFLSFGGGITGWGTVSDVGFVNVTVISAAEITVHTKSINFTSASVGESLTSYAATNVSTTDLLPCDADNHCGMNITNDGNIVINITIQESENLFDTGGYVANAHFLYNVTMQDPGYTTNYGANGNCSVGYDMGLPGVGGVGYWRGVPRGAAEVAICYLNASNTLGGAEIGQSSDTRPDVARVEFNITIPGDEPPGEKAGTITFTAIAA